MSPSDFRGISESDLKQRLKWLRKQIKENEHEQEVIGWTNISDGDWQIADQNIKGCLTMMDEIEAEFARRRQLRIERERA